MVLKSSGKTKKKCYKHKVAQIPSGTNTMQDKHKVWYKNQVGEGRTLNGTKTD